MQIKLIVVVVTLYNAESPRVMVEVDAENCAIVTLGRLLIGKKTIRHFKNVADVYTLYGNMYFFKERRYFVYFTAPVSL